MEDIYDFLFALSSEGTIEQVHYSSSGASLPMLHHRADWVGLTPQNIPNTQWAEDGASVLWEGQRFVTSRCQLADVAVLLLRRESQRDTLFQCALDAVADAVQIYDAEGKVVFYNRGALELLEYPSMEQLEGNYLLDVFAVDPDYSTTLSVLKTRTPIYNRFDRYKSTTGKDLSTVNTGIPILKDGVLLGCVTFERDMRLIQAGISRLQTAQNALLPHMPSSVKSVTSTQYTLDNLVGSDPELIAAKKLAAKMALKDVNILIQGETGTGKEIFAQGIHNLSARRHEKFVAVNCAAIPESLIEGLLFGTTKGAFTGSTDKTGLIEEANHGTLFLDELNSMSAGMQAKLLRVLQEKTLQRVGSTKTIPIDIRILSSCNEDAYQLSENGTLRTDLFYRLASVVIEIPPLRQRTEDIAPLTWYYIQQNQHLCPHPITKVAPAVWECFQRHTWPGNVRELFHVLNFALCDCEGDELKEDNLPARLRQIKTLPKQTGPSQGQHLEPGGNLPDFAPGFSKMVEAYERHILQQAYLACGRNATKTAAYLNMSRQNFQYYAKKYQLSLLE